MTARQPRALNAYLMLLAAWPFLERREQPLEAGVWARALSPEPPEPEWPPAATTRIWAALEEHGLVERSRDARLVRVRPRREDAAATYTRPRPDQEKLKAFDRFFILPDDYWTAGWFESLTLAGRAMLLLLLHNTSGRDSAPLPYERAADWYGLSVKTLQKGFGELRDGGLLQEDHSWVEEPLSAIGITRRTSYSLTGPFSRAARDQMQAQTKAATEARTAASGCATLDKPDIGEGG